MAQGSNDIDFLIKFGSEHLEEEEYKIYKLIIEEILNFMHGEL